MLLLLLYKNCFKIKSAYQERQNNSIIFVQFTFKITDIDPSSKFNTYYFIIFTFSKNHELSDLIWFTWNKYID